MPSSIPKVTDVRLNFGLRRTRIGVSLGLACLALSLGATAGAQEISRGLEVFNEQCAHCHGGNGQGGQLGPNILPRVAMSDRDQLTAFLRQGNPQRGMPPAAVNRRQLAALIDHLEVLSVAMGGSQVSDAGASTARRQIENFKPVTEQMLLHPGDGDWLWYSRTPDAQRFSPLAQVNKDNVSQLSLAWSRGLPDGITETIPTVYDGVMYLTLPGSNVAALDATTGDVLWRYERDYESPAIGLGGRSKTLSIFADMVYFTAPDSTLVALDAVTGEVRWEARVDARSHTSGSIVVEGKVIAGGACGGSSRANCYVSAHDAYTGELLWRFYHTLAADDLSGVDTWGGAPSDARIASTWGLPGGYDADTGLIYWSVANPMPNTRAARHGGDSDAIGYSAPTELYSNSTVALDPATGDVVWYYQHLPGDDWDEDMNQERVILRTPVDPDPAEVRWINPNIERGAQRDIVVNVGEGGGIWVLDKHTGEFLWATPFPEDVKNFVLSDIDVETGTTYINQDLIVDEPGEHHIICFFNTRSYWPTAYHPGKNALYVPYIRNCLNMTSAAPNADPPTGESRIGIAQPGVPLDELNGMAKVDMRTGKITHWPSGRVPTNSAVLATAGDLIFWGDINRRYRAMDADTGDVLWETILGGAVATSNVTYSVDGRQYIAVITGDTLANRGLDTGTMGPLRLNLDASEGNNSVYVFALPSESGAAGSPLPERHAADIELPAGPGKALLETVCTACHNLAGLAAYQGYWDRSRWASMVDTMVEYGAELSASETETVVAYLAQYFGPGTRQ